MKGVRLFVPATLVALSLTSAVIAQDRGRGRGFRGFGFNRPLDKVALIASEQVRKELEVTDEQKSKIDEVLAAYREERRDLFTSSGFRDLSREERRERFEEFRKKSAELREKTEKKLAKVLEKKQQKRLDQIALQQEGVDALVSDQVVAALKLDEKQVEKIRKALASRDEEIRAVFSSFQPGRRERGEGGERGERPDFGELREKARKARQEAEKTVLAFLSEEQQKKLEELEGEPFELDRESLRGRGGRGFGGGRGGRGERGGGERRERRRPELDDADGDDNDDGTEI